MRMTESIYWIASGYVGPFITAAGDCNVYLLRGPDGFVMIDAGGGKEPERIEQQMAWDQVDPAQIKAILLTHSHVDHAAGLPHWKAKTGAQLVAPEGAREHLTQGGPYHPSRPEQSVIPACPPEKTVRDGERFELAGLSFEAIAAPGHCPHMLCYLTNLDGRRLLITGDCFYWGGQITILTLPDSDPHVFKQTLEKLKGIEFDAFLPGHRYPVLEKAHEHIELACEKFNP